MLEMVLVRLSHVRRESLLNKAGYTLIEMMVTLAIVSILASVALPYAKMSYIRHNEMELRHSLRQIRGAIDLFYRDWNEGKLNKISGLASSDGYPRNLQVLVEGVPVAGKLNEKKKYLRRIPRDPFSKQSLPAKDQWFYVGYRDGADSQEWGGEDVYDVRSRSSRMALDESYYRDW